MEIGKEGQSVAADVAAAGEQDAVKIEGAAAEGTAENYYKVTEEFEIRDLDKPAMKKLRAAGLDPALPNKATKDLTTDQEKNAGLVDWMMDEIYPDLNIPYWKQIRLSWATYKKAYGGPEAIKNF